MMKTYLKKAFQLSDSGAKGLVKSIWSFFLYYVSFVPPMICVFLFADRLLHGNTGKPVVYLLFMLVATLVMYLVINYTAGGSFDPATDMSNMAPGAMGDPILCQFSAFFENPEIFAELDSTSDSQRVQEIYGMILNGIADQNLLVPVTGTHDLALWNTDKITGYDFYTDASYVDIASVHVK